MGVIYAEADDGPNLLLPFIVENGGCTDIQEVIRLYSAASTGKITSAEFWKCVDVNPALEDEYLQRHRLSDGLIEFLNEIHSSGMRLWCLSNDVSEWSRKLRRRFGLDRYFEGFVISGDAGAFKPDPAIYQCLLNKAGVKPAEALFVDDRLRNVKAADELGMSVVLFKPSLLDSQDHEYKIAGCFSELLALLQ